MLLSRNQIAIAALALSVAAPAVLLTAAEADAGPFDILRESREGGEREHKVKRKRKKTESRRDSDAESRGQHRTGRTRPAGSGSTGTQTSRNVRNVEKRRSARTGRTRDAAPHDRRSRTHRTGHVHTDNCSHNTRRDRRDDHYDRRRTRGHSHDHNTRRHRHGSSGTYSHSHSSSSSMSVSVSGSSASIRSHDSGYASSSSHYGSRRHRSDDYGHYDESSQEASSRVAMPEVFVSLGMGAAGFRADQIADKALPGQDYALALGVKGDWLGAELGVSGAGYRLDPDAQGSDIALAGVTADVRLQPKIDFIEPYLKAGVGAHRMHDVEIDESSSGTSLRLGAGVDFRGDHLGVGVEYLWSTYGFQGDTNAYGGHLGAQSGAIGARILYHF